MKIEIIPQNEIRPSILPKSPLTLTLFHGDRWFFASWGVIARNDEGVVVGLATVGDQGEGTGRPTIIGIYVLASHRRQKVGTQLLAATIEEARERGLLPLLYEALTPSGLALAQAGGYGPDALDIRELHLGPEWTE